MLDYLIPMSPALVPLVIVLWASLRRRDCPDCGALLPVLYSPFRKTRRMWRAGGYLCAQCGCETDMEGRKVAVGATAPFPAGAWALVGVLLLVGTWLGVAGLFVGGRAVAAPPAVAPPGVAAPPIIVLPLQAPPPRVD